MGQWGALGYALGQDAGQGNWTWPQIVTHYYGPATLQLAASDAQLVTIALTENDGQDVIATAPAGVTVPGRGGTAPAVLFAPVGSLWNVYVGAGCGGSPGVGWGAPVATVANPSTGAADGGLIQLCRLGGNPSYHGQLSGRDGPAGAARTVSVLALGQYVGDVVPSESPSSWGTLGGPGPQGQAWGFQELEAQAVAARSYVLSTPLGFGGYADTCDLTCQSYPGTTNESALASAAVAGTAGEVMILPGQSIPAPTEYSASTGGYTASSAAPENSPFTAVPDDGDGVCVPGACNPSHNWEVSIPVSTIQAIWPSIGSLQAINVISRNGLGALGGRVGQLTLVGTAGSLSMFGTQFAGALGLRSDWFAIGGAPSGGTSGYWLAAADGGIFSFGNAAFFGSMGGRPLFRPIVGMAPAPGDGGYWEVASDGGIFSFGTAAFFGSMGGRPLNQPIVGVAAVPGGGGYWEVASDGGIFAFGSARFFGSMGGRPLNQPIVGMAATPDGGGYWLVAADGGIFAFGDAGFFGSTGAIRLVQPIVGMARAPSGGGYWLVASDGGVFTFGVPFEGSAAGTADGSGVVGILPSGDGDGYLVLTADGSVVPFGDAPELGDVTTADPGYPGRIVGGVATPG